MANKNLFNSIQITKPGKNVFDLSHDVKLSLDMGELIPTMALECVPGDKFNLSCESLLRFAPLTSPVMHRFDVTMHYFFVPNRLVWDGWEKFITDPNSGKVAPYLSFSDAGGLPTQRLWDYLGIPEPTGTVGYNPRFSALPLAAYQAIYHEYYRDQNLIPEFDYKLSDGSNSAKATMLNTLRTRAWEHDYFTSCLPWAQKGDPVGIPVSGDVTLKPTQGQPGTPGLLRLKGDHSFAPNQQDLYTGVTGGSSQGAISTSNYGEVVYDPNGTLEVANADTTINDLRRAFRLQEWLEKSARAGTRYIEKILAHFGVKSSDARLQRPEYITGTKSPVVISEVLNTTGTDDRPQGDMAGHAVSVTSGQYGSYFCEEHGYIIGIMSVLPKTAYQQGIPRHFKKFDCFDYYWPEFAHIGEQEVMDEEIFMGTGTAPEGVFGYVPRYSEYKYMPSRVCGDFKTTLQFWHHGRIFANKPALNQAFVECKPDKRIFAVTDPTQQSLWCHVYHKVKAVRPMPFYGTPSF